MKKHLQSFIHTIQYLETIEENKNPLIDSLEFDSRKVHNGTLFFALPGTHVHGNDFIEKALLKGASAVIFQDELTQTTKEALKKSGIPAFKVADSRFSMAPIAAEFYDNPAKKMIIFGVTGTEGKSTTVFLLWQLLTLMGKKAGFFSTVQYSLGNEAIDNPEHQTTPEAPIVQNLLYQMSENGCEFAIIEASSHGLSKKTNRLGNITFNASAMMNVTHEHLEFHKTHEQYKSDKANLFRSLGKTCSKQSLQPFGVVNLEDPSAHYFLEQTTYPVYGFTTYGEAGSLKKQEIQNKFDYAGIFVGHSIKADKKGCSFIFEYLSTNENNCFSIKEEHKQKKIKLGLPGTFNIYNTMAAIILVAGIVKKSPFEIAEYAHSLEAVKGRMTRIDNKQPFEVYVDYAHTPSSFKTIFKPLKEKLAIEKKGRLLALFGSGGERDTKKRPVQGAIASEFCDIVLLCDEDPRGENPKELLEEIAIGCKNKTLEKDLFIIPDRKKAIRKAFSLAQKNDIVLLLGKAHENSIIYKDFIMPYDEITEASKALNEMGYH